MTDIARQELIQFRRSHWSTLLAENLGNATRKISRDGPSGGLNGSSVWHAMSMGSPTCDDRSRPVVLATPARRSIAAPQLPKDMHRFSDRQNYLPSDLMQTITETKPSWPTLSPAHWKLASLKSSLLVHCEGDWSRIQSAWLSAIMVPGSLAFSKQEKKTYLVLCASASGF